jgi:hypothetical protein
MRRAASPIQPAAIELRTMRGVLASVRIQAQFDILDEDGMIIAIHTARMAPSRMDVMHRFELTTCYRLADGASGVVRSDTLVRSENPQCVSHVWEINEADILVELSFSGLWKRVRGVGEPVNVAPLAVQVKA